MAGQRRFHLDHRWPDVAKLETIRKKRGESMVDFARSLCISLSTYHDFVRAVRKPRAIVMRLADYLEKDLPAPKKGK